MQLTALRLSALLGTELENLMEMFVWFIAGILALDIAEKLIRLYQQYQQYQQDFERKASSVALDTAVNIGLLAWAVWVLAHGS